MSIERYEEWFLKVLKVRSFSFGASKLKSGCLPFKTNIMANTP